MKYLVPIAALFLAGCTGPPPEWRDGNYVVYARPNSDEIIMGYYMGDGAILGLSDPTVVAAGSDSRYVVFERTTENGNSEFYIIRKRDGEAGNPGSPFTDRDYAQFSTEQSLPAMTWRLQ